MTQPIMDFDNIARKHTNRTGGRPQKYFLDEPGRRLLIAKYDGTTPIIDELAERLHVPRWKVRNWAQQFGLARQRDDYWAEADVQYLETNLHRMSLGAIAKKLGRTKVAVRLKAKRIGINKSMEGYTMRGLCMGLGCDHHKITTWLELGWIIGRRRHTERQDLDMWYFSDDAVKKFVFAHPNEIDQRRVDWLWLIDILSSNNTGQGLGDLSGKRNKAEE